MVEALANITVPEFVDPTPASQHVYTVYVGSQLFIPLYARPSPDSPTDIVVKEFQLLSLPDHPMTAQPLVSDTSRAEDRVVKSALEWRTIDSDAGDYLIQAVAIDSDENKIVSIEVVNQETNITGVESTSIEKVHYRGQDVYRTDIRFTSDMIAYDQCSSHPCKNNPRACTDLGVMGVACRCSDGWTGDLCEIDEVDCQPDSCKNGGACVDEHMGFHCECPAGYGGVDCSHGNEDTPITRPGNTLTPHVIVPSARPGMKISCEVGASCQIPIYLTGSPGSPPTLTPGITSPGVTTSLTPPQTDKVTGFTDTANPHRHPQGYPVRSLTPNAHVFEARPDGSSTCGTDILLAPQNSTEKVCISAGTTGLIVLQVTRATPVRVTMAVSVCPMERLTTPVSVRFPTLDSSVIHLTTANPKDVVIMACALTLERQGSNVNANLASRETTVGKVAPAECVTKDCQNGAICVEEDGHAVCKCPMGKEGDTCMDTDKDVPLRPKPDDELNKPHAVVPSPGNGLEITCDVGKTCEIPVFLKGEISTPPRLTTGPTSPEVTAHVAPIPREAATPPDTLTSPLQVTPTEPGTHHVCVEIHDPENPNDVDDNICYNIVSTAGTTTTPAPGIDNGQFKNTPEAGSKVHCRTDTPCHIVAQTERPPNGECTPVRSQSVGVYAFETTEVDATTCSTDMLLDPKYITSGQACMKVGFQGEERCFAVDSIDGNADPCGANPCVHGLCIPTGPTTHTCACPVPYKGNDCSETPELCDTVTCQNGAICVTDNGDAVCKCPLGKDGSDCNADNGDHPINPLDQTHKSNPHVIVPTPGNGMEIKCEVGSRCEVPVYMTGGLSPAPNVTTGPTSPDIMAGVSAPKQISFPTMPTDPLTSTLTVIPTKEGTHHVCVEVDSGGQKDDVCYTIVGTSPDGTTSSPTAAPTSTPAGGRFSSGTPPDGTKINCHEGTPCHLIAQTEKPLNGDCTQVKSASTGVYAFRTSELDTGTCGTDVLLDPANIPSGHQACIEVGTGGEKRCFTVNNIDDTTENDCTSLRCVHNSVCKADPINGFTCECRPGYSGDACSQVPDACLAKGCHEDSVCILNGNDAVCICTLGRGGDTCDEVITEEPLTPGLENSTKAHAVAPTPPNGQEIVCHVGATCKVPIFMTGSNSTPPVLTTDLSSPNLRVNVSPPGPSTIPGTSLMSELSVTPTTVGSQHVCVDIKDGTASDHVCYNIVAEEPQSHGSSTTIAPGSHIGTQGYRFTERTPSNGENLSCPPDKICYMLVETDKTPNGECLPVITKTVGVYVGETYDLGRCTTVFVVDPHNIPQGEPPCLEIGPGGERRCYGVSPSTVDQCPTVRCVNNGVCEDGPSGLKCNCLPGYTGGDCRHRPDTCFDQNCDPDSVCLIQNNVPVCKCPFDKGEDRCQTANPDIPLNSTVDTNKPHVVVPSPINGLEITCEMGKTCQIPVYMTGESGNPPKSTAGPTSREVNINVPPPHPSQIAPGRFVTPVTVTPTTPGRHHVCVQIEENDGMPVEDVCYTVNTPAAGKCPVLVGVFLIRFTAYSLFNRVIRSRINFELCFFSALQETFTGGTPPDGSTVNCRKGIPCHLIVQTANPGTGGCKPARPQTVGVLVFMAKEEGGLCNSDILIDPDLVGGNKACVDAG
ncbi:hypothetical protein BaRGS_00003994 [Batillaria attramentaria]|uniref:EGF-like domain-containing protein n=1 Tax=Batillaria attramentaria TaxID=370345 RepID=A0ABD0M0B5_9CAEN